MLAVWLVLLVPAAAGSFTSIHVFGDGVSTTTHNTSPTPRYGNRYCNGRVWIEVLSQWQGLPYEVAFNNSFFGHDSDVLLGTTAALVPPPDVATALFIVWVNNADLVLAINNPATAPPYGPSKIPAWNAFISQTIENHETAVTTLHNKGVRHLVLPGAVDIMAIPRYNQFSSSNKAFVRQRIIELNAAFAISLDGLRDSLPGLTIHSPDTFAFVNDVVANPADYGVGNPTLAAISAIPGAALDGPGADYVWWDPSHPTAKIQMYLADLVQQQICPLGITRVGVAGRSVSLDLQNIPLDRAGLVEGRAGPEPWQEDATIFEPFDTGNPNATILFPSPTPTRLQRVRFPVQWVWP